MINITNNFPNFNAKIRLLQASPNLSPIDIYCDGALLVSNIKFGGVTKFLSLSPGTHTIEFFKSSTYENPIFKKTIEILPKSQKTISIVFCNKSLNLVGIDDNPSLCPKDETAKLRFINLSPNSPLLTLKQSNNKPLFNNVEFLEKTNFHSLSQGLYNFKLTSPSLNNFHHKISNISLAKNVCTTIYIIGILGGEPELGYLLTRIF